jgi:translation elongation factor EF-Ts
MEGTAAPITARDVKRLMAATGRPMTDCRGALVAAAGDMAVALEQLLRGGGDEAPQCADA